mmetsp:Transcript_31745/g.73680  ORF Transcript_31745/g.73680 Transcript_31745/m.73680 type:complete len:108 (+) Transcript_31745:86-409(+)
MTCLRGTSRQPGSPLPAPTSEYASWTDESLEWRTANDNCPCPEGCSSDSTSRGGGVPLVVDAEAMPPAMANLPPAGRSRRLSTSPQEMSASALSEDLEDLDALCAEK